MKTERIALTQINSYVVSTVRIEDDGTTFYETMVFDAHDELYCWRVGDEESAMVNHGNAVAKWRVK
jgi:hypothetical protein